MADSWRTFIATRVSGLPALDELLAGLCELGPSVRPVAANRLHLTLKFLGETSPIQIPKIIASLETLCHNQSPVPLAVRGLGAFPDLRRARVAWAGLFPTEPIAELADEIEGVMAELGFARESRPFRPHLTLARIRGRCPAGLVGLIRSQEETNLGRFRMNRIALIRSHRGHNGGQYETLHECQLSDPG